MCAVLPARARSRLPAISLNSISLPRSGNTSPAFTAPSATHTGRPAPGVPSASTTLPVTRCPGDSVTSTRSLPDPGGKTVTTDGAKPRARTTYSTAGNTCPSLGFAHTTSYRPSASVRGRLPSFPRVTLAP